MASVSLLKHLLTLSYDIKVRFRLYIVFLSRLTPIAEFLGPSPSATFGNRGTIAVTIAKIGIYFGSKWHIYSYIGIYLHLEKKHIPIIP